MSFGIVALAAALHAAPAHAIPVPTTANDLIINFDFTGASPSPSYSSVTTSLSFSGLGVGSTLTIDRFTGLNGTGSSTSTTIVGSGAATNGLTLTTGNPGFLDGLYSLGVRLDQGTASLDTFTAAGTSGDGTASINGVVLATVGVPEPLSIALLGTGLVGTMVARRRRKA